MRLNEKQQLSLFIGVFAVIVIGECVFGYTCLQDRGDLNAEISRLKKEELAAQAKIRQIPELRKVSEELAQIIEEYAEILPTEREVGNDKFLEDIEKFLDGTGIIMITGAPVEEKRRSRNQKDADAQRNNFIQHKYRFTFEGPFLGFVKFINRVENHTRFLEILSFEIRSSGDTGRSNMDPAEEVALAEDTRKQIEVVVSTYTYSKAKNQPEPETKK